MSVVPYQVVVTDMLPTAFQIPLLEELVESTYQTYCWVLDGLAEGRWQINEDNMLDVVDTVIRNDWMDNRPVGLCPMVMMKYLHREACHNWLDNEMRMDVIPEMKAAHADSFYVPASGHSILKDGSIWINGVGRVRVRPVKLSGRMYLIIGKKLADRWVAGFKTAVE